MSERATAAHAIGRSGHPARLETCDEIWRTGIEMRCWHRTFIVVLCASLALPACARSASDAAFRVDAQAISADHRHGCAILSDRTVSCWGENRFAQLGDGTTEDSPGTLVPVAEVSGASQLATGEDFTCAIVSGGAVRCWGLNLSGQIGDGATYAISGASTPVPGVRGTVSVAAGRDHACAASAEGTVACWGANHSGQLGDGTQTDRLRPVTVRGIDDAVALSAGAGSSCALLSSGAVSCWGVNGLGQLGDSTRTDRVEPAPVWGLDGVVAIDAQLAMTCALRRDGSAWCWGTPGDGSDGTATPMMIAGVASASDVAVGEAATCVLTDTGTTCWKGISDAEPRDVAAEDPVDLSMLGSSLCTLSGNDQIACSPID